MLKQICGALVLLLMAVSALATDAQERKFIRQGVAEAQLLARIGTPDSENTEIDSRGNKTVVTTQRWMYMPTGHGSQTSTTMVIENGSVLEMKREIRRR